MAAATSSVIVTPQGLCHQFARVTTNERAADTINTDASARSSAC